MKTLYLDTFSGISGDMFLGLLIDLGLDPHRLQQHLDLLPVHGYRLDIAREQRHGISGTRVMVAHKESHHHRHWSNIDKMLADSSLPEEMSLLARAFFHRLGKAEAKVHGIDIDQVHFHEVGAIDAIIDLTGAAIGLKLLGIDRVICAPLPMSRGMSQCAHGVLPLPAPATLEILQGKPVCDSGCDKELVTPTGATIVAELADFSSLPTAQLGRTGYGVGGWQLEDRPNLLRGILYEGTGPAEKETISILETHIDDSTPEELGYLLDQLLGQGALDVSYTPLHMKKNRPAQKLTVICLPQQADELAQLVLEQSSAIGLRSISAERYLLDRREEKISTPLGEAQVKLLYQGERFLRLSPEYEDCRRLAEIHKRPLHEIFHLVESSAYKQLKLRDLEKE